MQLKRAKSFNATTLKILVASLMSPSPLLPLSILSFLSIHLLPSPAQARVVEYPAITDYQALKEAPLPTKKGEHGLVEIEDLRPTQMSLGYKAVNAKVRKIQKMSRERFREYMLDNPVPVVIGHDGAYYIIDHHHLTRALWEIDKSRVHVVVIDKVDADSATAFWEKMLEKNYALDHKPSGQKLKNALSMARLLPKTIEEMQDDPYRSLAGEVREENGFRKNDEDFYIEFIWADFFREKIPLHLLNKNWEYSFEFAMHLARSKDAAHLPGYRPMNCVNNLR